MTLPRSVRIKTHVYGLDHETFGSNETRSTSWEEAFLLNDQQTVLAPKIVMGWGGECRVEISYNVQVLNDLTTIRLFGEALLFEGTSEETEELNGRKPFDYNIGSTRDVPDISLRNRVDNQSEGDDYADFTFEVRNVARPVD